MKRHRGEEAVDRGHDQAYIRHKDRERTHDRVKIRRQHLFGNAIKRAA
jgi:hypothetical protein